jgi:hypothetical protein
MDIKTALSMLIDPDNPITQSVLQDTARDLLRRAEERAGRRLDAEQIRRSAKHIQIIADTLNTIANERHRDDP